MNTCKDCCYSRDNSSVCFRYPPVFTSHYWDFPKIHPDMPACGEFSKIHQKLDCISPSEIESIKKLLSESSERNLKLFELIRKEKDIRTKELLPKIFPCFHTLGTIDSTINRAMKRIGAKNRYHFRSMLLALHGPVMKSKEEKEVE